MSARVALPVAGLLAAAASLGRAQSPWSAQLAIDPYPSPYLSDWESNPALGTLTVTNPTGADQQVLLVYHVTQRDGRVIASGRSDPQPIPAGPPTVLTDFVDLSGSSTHDQGLEDQMRRTGRLPEGDHTACVAVTDLGGFVLAEDCVTFTIVYPDPPYLIGPLDDEALTSGNPILQWTPLQVPPAFQLTYVVRVSEVLAAQTPAQALVANIPVFETTTFGTNLEYPISAPPLEDGKTYVWQVQALDQNGYAASGNEGRSEIWTFRFAPNGINPPQAPAGPYGARFTFYDPATEAPEFWAMLDTTSFPRFLEYVLLQARNGTLEIPLPLAGMLAGAGVGASGSGDGAGWDMGGEAPGGGSWKSRPIGTTERPGQAVPGCGPSDLIRAGVYQDTAKKSLAILVQFGDNWVVNFLDCMDVPAWNRPPVDQPMAAMLAIDYGHGVPRVTLGLKPPSLDVFDLNLSYAVFVINLVGDFTMRSSDLPDEVHDFYGDHEFEVWGTGTIDLGVKLAKFFKSIFSGGRGQAAKDLLAQLGINFYAVVEWYGGGNSGTLGGILERPELELQGFKGYREKTYRGLGAGTGGAGRVEQKIRYNWFVQARVPVTPPSFMSGATAGWCTIRFTSRDSAVARTFKLVGDNSPMETRYQITFRLSFEGFDAWKPWLGVDPDSVLAFYTELGFETVRYTSTDTVTTRGRSNTAWQRYDDFSEETGLRWIASDRAHNPQREGSTTRVDTTSSTGLGVALTFGTDATFTLPGPVYLHDVNLTVRRADAAPPIGSTSPFQHMLFVLGGDFGFGPLARIGRFTIEMGRRTSSDTTRSTRRRLTPEERQRLAGEVGVRQIERENPQRSVEETKTVTQRRQWQFRVKLQFDQGATAGALLGWLFQLVKP